MAKKVIFSAIALIGMTIASYGANHVKKEEKKLSDSSRKIEEKTEVVSHTCYYDIYKDGKLVGHVIMTEVPDNVSCGSKQATTRALDLWQQAQ